MKKILLVLLCLILFTGCTKEKTSISGDDFVKLMDKEGYTVYDATESFPYAKSAYITKEFDIKVVYIKGNKKSDVRGLFLDQCKNVYSNIEENYKDKKTSGSNWSTLEAYDNYNYYFVSLIDDTYVYITGPVQDKKEIKNIYKTLGY